MPLAKDLESYEDLRSHWTRAIASTNGIGLTCATHGEAISLRARLYAMRKLERKRSLEIYEPEHPMRGMSPFENFSIEVQDNRVLIRHREPVIVEDL